MKDKSYKVLSMWILQILFYFTTVHVTKYEHALIFTIIYVIINVLFLFLADKTAFIFLYREPLFQYSIYFMKRGFTYGVHQINGNILLPTS